MAYYNGKRILSVVQVEPVPRNLQEKTATPLTTQVQVLPDNNCALSKVTINPVTSAIDPSITAGNIKRGVSILGVIGTLSSDSYIKYSGIDSKCYFETDITLIPASQFRKDGVGGILTDIYLPLCTRVKEYAFYNQPLTSVYLPLCITINYGAFRNCASLEEIDLPVLSDISTSTFMGDSSLTKVILRNSTLVSLSNIDAFSDTPIASGTGFIYVPDNLVDAYKVATNWSTYASQIKGISELPTEG